MCRALGPPAMGLWGEPGCAGTSPWLSGVPAGSWSTAGPVGASPTLSHPTASSPTSRVATGLPALRAEGAWPLGQPHGSQPRPSSEPPGDAKRGPAGAGGLREGWAVGTPCLSCVVPAAASVSIPVAVPHVCRARGRPAPRSHRCPCSCCRVRKAQLRAAQWPNIWFPNQRRPSAISGPCRRPSISTRRSNQSSAHGCSAS